MSKVIAQYLSSNRDDSGSCIDVVVSKDDYGSYGMLLITEGRTIISYGIGSENLTDIDDIIKGLTELKERLNDKEGGRKS